MNWADYTILAVVLVSVVIGALRGFTREILGVLGWVLAFWAAAHFAADAAEWLAPRIETPAVRKAVAFGGVFLGVLLLAAIATFLLTMLIRESPLAGIDRTLGGGFGFLRGLFVIAVLLMVAGTTAARDDPWWQQSVLVPHLEWMADGLHAITPKRWLQVLEPEPKAPTSAASQGSP